MPQVTGALRAGRKAALVFGPERTGLTNEQITLCHYLVQIPAAHAYAALNLAQAAAICLYELHQAWTGRREAESPQETANWAEAAPFAEQDRMFAQMKDALEQIHFLYGEKAEPLMHALRHVLGRARLSTMEVQVLQGLARQIAWCAQHRSAMAAVTQPTPESGG
jgi:tRNA/rRNA methyltransferase